MISLVYLSSEAWKRHWQGRILKSPVHINYGQKWAFFFIVLEALGHSDLNIQRREQNIKLARFHKSWATLVREWWQKCRKRTAGLGSYWLRKWLLFWKPLLWAFKLHLLAFCVHVPLFPQPNIQRTFFTCGLYEKNVNVLQSTKLIFVIRLHDS